MKKVIIKSTGNRSGESKIAKLLKIIAILTYVGGFICGLVFANQEITYLDYTYKEFVWSVAIIVWSGYFVFGSLMLGFSEIVRILYNIQYNEFEASVPDELFLRETTIREAKENNRPIVSEKNSEDMPSIISRNSDQVTFEFRPSKIIVCPNCGFEQSADCNMCEKCETKFIFKSGRRAGD